MTMTDPIADMLTRIRNAIMSGAQTVDVPRSRIKEQIARVLLEEGFIAAWKSVEASPCDLLRVYLKQTDYGAQVIRGIRRISTPGRRVYRRAEELRPVLSGTGVAVVSTSQGLMSDRQCRDQRVGGEVLCEVW